MRACPRNRSRLWSWELTGAPAAVRKHLTRIPEQHIEVVQINAEATELAAAYIRDGAIPATMRVDAQHIAIASVARVDVLVSWNFKHIVSLRRIRGYNFVNYSALFEALALNTKTPRHKGTKKAGIR